jgi:LacI family transcriptional regulator
MRKKRVTLRLLSERTGFDVSTISRVLRNDATLSIRPENVLRIKQVAQELNYMPDIAARSLRSARSYSIATLLPSLQNQIHAQIVEGASRVCRHGGYSLIIAHAAPKESQQDIVSELVSRNRIDAVMSLTFREELHGLDVPAMAVNWRAPGFEHWVTLDERPGARLATEHLIALGHRRIAHLSGDLTRFNAIERCTGYREALAAAGLAFDSGLVEPAGYGYEDGLRAMHALLDRQAGGFTAVFALSMLTAAGAISALQQRGLRVPQDMSVVGFNDAILAEIMNPSLTTVAYPLIELGAAAARGMIALLENPGTQVRETVGGARLIQRGSAAPPG